MKPIKRLKSTTVKTNNPLSLFYCALEKGFGVLRKVGASPPTHFHGRDKIKSAEQTPPFFTFILVPANSWEWRPFESVTHESTLSVALHLEAGPDLLSTIYTSKGLYQSMLLERERVLSKAGLTAAAHSATAWPGLWKKLQLTARLLLRSSAA